MSPQGAPYARRPLPYARRSVWIVVAVLSVIVVVGFALAGYEINHLRDEINGLQAQTRQLNSAIVLLEAAIKSLAQHAP